MERYSANDRVVFIDRTRDSKLSDFSKATLDDRYLLKGESYQDLFARVACAYSDDDAHAQRIYDYMSKLWFLGATPVLSNGGAGRGLPISCFLNQASDSLKGIVDLWNENVWLASNGGGIGSYWGDLRSIGENVSKAGKTSGIIPFIKVMDSMTLAISQGSLRRGSAAVYLDIGHPEIEEFLEIRKPTGGDPNRKALNLNHAVMIPDAFMRALEVDGEWELKSPHTNKVAKTVRARDLWYKILTLRIETGEPYIVFADRANEAMPEHHKKSGLKIKTSNLCFTGDTMVAVADGRNAVSIKELAERDERFPVYSAGIKNRRRFGKPGGGATVTSAWKSEIKGAVAFKTGTREVVKVTLSNGDHFKCTPDHQLAMIDGSYVSASDSVGKELESFFSFTSSVGSPYRHINSVTSNKQHHLIWDFYNPNEPRKRGEHIDHVTSVRFGADVCAYDNIKNLKKLQASDHHKKTGEEALGENNPIHKCDPKWRSEYVSKTTIGKKNPTYSGIDNHTLIEMGKDLFEKHGSMTKKLYKEHLVSIGAPKTFSKYRFGGGSVGFKKYVEYVSGNVDYDGGYDVEPTFVKRTNPDVERLEYIHNHFYETVGEDLVKKGLIVVSVEYDGIEDVYDLTVDDNHNFYIITSGDKNYLNSQGVLVHNCSEILLPTGTDHHGKNRTAVCCLSSLNLETYEEWENDDYIIEDVLRFLDNVLQDFIDRAPPGMESAKYSAMMERSVGLGVMGWHSFLQKRMIPMESVMAKVWNNRIFSRFKHKCDEANEKLAIQKGACPDAAEYGVMRRFSNCSAVAPTASISIIASNSSPGIEPYAANAFTHKTLTGSFPVRNKYLAALLKEKEMDTQEVWSSIITNLGSVQHLDFLSDLEKDVFKTAFEIDQRWIIDLAADRTPFIDQSQSLNLFLPADVDKKVLNFLHFLAWKKGVKSLYYCRSRSLKRSEVVSSKVVRERLPEVKEVALDECLSCQ